MPDSISSKSAAEPQASSARGRARSFLALPFEIRNKIYKFLFVCSHPIYIFQDCPGSGSIESFIPDIQSRRNSHNWPALLYTNRQISAEARAILYGANAIQLMEVPIQQPGSPTLSLLKSFLDRIGPVNAGLLSCLHIDFPAIEEKIERGSGGDHQSTRQIRIRKDGRWKLQLLQAEFAGLRVLDMVYTGSGLIATGAEVTQEVLQEINTYFQAIPSLSRIIVRVSDEPPRPFARVRGMMQQLGWIVLSGERYSISHHHCSSLQKR